MFDGERFVAAALLFWEVRSKLGCGHVRIFSRTKNRAFEPFSFVQQTMMDCNASKRLARICFNGNDRYSQDQLVTIVLLANPPAAEQRNEFYEANHCLAKRLLTSVVNHALHLQQYLASTLLRT